MVFSSRALLAGVLLAPAAFGLTGCAGLPASAPTSGQLESPQENQLDVLILKADPAVMSVLDRSIERGFSGLGANTGYRPSLSLRAGDAISVSIYETGGQSLFGAPAASGTVGGVGDASRMSPGATSLPAQIIEPSGQISVPFVGRVSVAGLTPIQAGKRIEGLLAARALTPQVVVSLVSSGANAATVSGEVNRPASIPLTLRGERLLDVIANAGGVKYTEFDTDIRVQRGGRVGVVPLKAIVSNPSYNIPVQPGDQIIALRNARTYTFMGAAQKVAQYTLDQDHVSLIEAVARAGGSVDTTGDLGGLYVFRSEPLDVVRSILAAKADAIDPSSPRREIIPDRNGRVPVLYRFDLQHASGYFYAKSMNLRDKDVVLLTNAEGAQLLKLFTAIRGMTGMVYDIGRNSSVYR